MMPLIRWMLLGAKWGFLFAWEIARANWSLMRVILGTRTDSIYPGFVRYDVRDLSRWERVILSHAITLTPGTTSVDWENSGNTLIIHALDARNPTALRQDIDQKLRAPLVAWWRAFKEPSRT